MAKPNDLEIQIGLLAQQVSTFISAAQEINKDHEARLRRLEDLMTKLDGKVDKELGVIKERQTISNMVQVAFTSIATVLAALFKVK